MHKIGACPVGEASVVIAVSSAHRKEAIEAMHFAIDELKRTVPIWKKVRSQYQNLVTITVLPEEIYRDHPPAWKENAEQPQGYTK